MINVINAVTEAIKAALNWIRMILDAAIDWGWIGPSEGIVLITGLIIIGVIIRKLLRSR